MAGHFPLPSLERGRTHGGSDGDGGGGEAEYVRYGSGTPMSDDLHDQHSDSHGTPPPPSASGSTLSKASVARVAKACVPCSTKKRRCDGGKPQCKVCMVLGTPCSYDARGLKRGPPKGFRSGPKESARAKLLRTLETTIRDLSLHVGRDDASREIARISFERGIHTSSMADGRSDQRSRSSSTTMKRMKRESSAPAAGAEMDDDDDEDMIGISEQGNLRYIGSSSGIPLLHHHPSSTAAHTSSPRDTRFRSSPRGSQPPIPLPSVPTATRMHSSPSSLSGPSPHAHPTSLEERQIGRAMNRRLFHHYWSGFHPIWPILYKPALDDIHVDDLPSTLDFALVNAIYALAVCVASPSLDAELEAEIGEGPPGDIFAQRAERYLFFQRSAPVPSFSSIQCCFLLSCYHQGAGQLSKAYLLSSLANSMAMDLGLHRHLHHYKHDLIERESRSRLVHCIYILSMLLSAEMGRPPMLRSKDIDVPPLGEMEKDEFEVDHLGRQLHTPSLLNNSRRLFAIVETVLTQVHSFRRKAALRRMGSEGIRQVVDEIEQTLEAWRRSLPDYLRLPEDVKGKSTEAEIAPSFAAVQLWYYTAKLLLHRPFIPQDEGLSLTELLNDKYHQKCTQSSQALFELLSLLARSSNVDQLSTDLAYIIFTAAVMFVFNARLGYSSPFASAESANGAANSEQSRRTAAIVHKLATDSKRQFLMCKEWLKRLSERWPAASAHKQLLDGFSMVGEGVVGGKGHSFTGRRPSLVNGSLIPVDPGPPQSGWRGNKIHASPSLFGTGDGQQRGGQSLNSSSRRSQYSDSYETSSVASGNADAMSNDSQSAGSQAFNQAPNASPAFAYQQGPMMTSNGPDNSGMTGSDVPPQQSLNAYFEFAPNIFDMENVYWNETTTRLTPFLGPRDGSISSSSGGGGGGGGGGVVINGGTHTSATNGYGLPNNPAAGAMGSAQYTPRTLGAMTAVANYASIANLGPPQLPTSQAPSQQQPSQPMGPPQSNAMGPPALPSTAPSGSKPAEPLHNSPGLQMLAQQAVTSAPPGSGAGTGSAGQMAPFSSPFSLHQEPSAPEWGDVISMLQLPPAFIQ